jgi:uncharacterized membrane protein YbhN (UPF0104 family)
VTEAARPASAARRIGVAVLRVSLAVLPLYWMSRRLRWRDVYVQATETSPAALLLAVGCVWCAIAAGTLRWRLLLRAYGSDRVPGFWTMLRHNLIGMYFNVLPGAVAGDAVRGYRLREESGGLVRAYYVLLVERVCGLSALLVLGLLPWIVPGWVESTQGIWWMRVCAAGVGGIAVGVLALRLLRGPLGRIPRLASLEQAARPRRLAPLGLALILSLVTQGCTVLAWYELVSAAEPATLAGEALVGIVGTVLLTFVPITPAGLGQRELITLYQLRPAGVGATAAVTSSLLWLAAALTGSAAGGLVLLVEQIRRRRS